LGLQKRRTNIIYAMNFTRQELIYIRNNLLSSRMYKGAKLPHNAVIWEEWMHDFLKKINNQLDK